MDQWMLMDFCETTWIYRYHARRKFRSQTSDNMDRWKAELGKGREKRRVEESRSEKRKSQKKEDADARKWKGRKVAKQCVFPMICGSGGSNSRLAKAAGAEPADQMKNCTPLWREAHFEVKMYKAPQLRSTFRSCAVEKVHVSKSKCAKHPMLGPLLEVEMSKKCTLLWREAHFEVKMYKTPGVRTTFGRSDVVSRGRRKGLCTLSKVSKTWGFCSIFNYSHHYTTLHSNTLHFTSLQLQLHLHYIPLHYTTLHYTQLHSITLNYTTLHYTTQHYTTFHYTTTTTTTTFTTTTTTATATATTHYATLIALHYTTLHYATLHYTTHYATLHYATLPYTTLIALHYTTLHYSTLHYITLHYTTPITPPQMQLQLHYTNYITPPLQLHQTTTTTTAALHHATSSSCGWGDRPGDHCNHCSHSKKHSSNHLSVHEWVRSAIRDSQQPTSPIGFLFLKLPPPTCAVLLVSRYISGAT